MRKFFKKTMKEERGDVVQYIIVLAVVAVILAFAFPKIKTAMKSGTDSTITNVECAFTAIDKTCATPAAPTQ